MKENKLILKISLYDDNHEYLTDTYDVEKIKGLLLTIVLYESLIS